MQPHNEDFECRSRGSLDRRFAGLWVCARAASALRAVRAGAPMRKRQRNETYPPLRGDVAAAAMRVFLALCALVLLLAVQVVATPPACNTLKKKYTNCQCRLKHSALTRIDRGQVQCAHPSSGSRAAYRRRARRDRLAAHGGALPKSALLARASATYPCAVVSRWRAKASNPCAQASCMSTGCWPRPTKKDRHTGAFCFALAVAQLHTRKRRAP